jgi:hypothetical protein
MVGGAVRRRAVAAAWQAERVQSLIVPNRFNGPPHSGNGGWTAGALAATLPAALRTPVTARLRQPPPLDTPMPIEETASGAVANRHGRPVVEVRYAERDPLPVPPVPVKEAAEAEARYAGHRTHPFPTCFTCGTTRRADDGLRIFAGPVDDPGASTAARGRVAATWTPYEVSVPIMWAALDCPGGWASDIEERPMVLGQITVRVRELVETSERYVVVGAVRGQEGRKTFTATTIYDPDNRILATAEHIWIAVDPATFGG